jgi:hypothetical protein
MQFLISFIRHQLHFNPGAANWHNTQAVIPSAACTEPPEDEQVMLETRRDLNS